MDKKLILEIAVDPHQMRDAAAMLYGFADSLEGLGIAPTTSLDTAALSSSLEALRRDAHTAPAPTGSETATDGVPWDERIHASTRAKLADGTWRLRRRPKDTPEGDWDAYVEQVKQELAGTEQAPAPGGTEQAPAPGGTASAPGPDAAAAFGGAEQAPAPGGAITTFPELMNAIYQRGYNTNDVTAACQQVGVDGFPLLAAQPDKIPAVAALLFGGGNG